MVPSKGEVRENRDIRPEMSRWTNSTEETILRRAFLAATAATATLKAAGAATVAPLGRRGPTLAIRTAASGATTQLTLSRFTS
jgi:hypothetical protein